MSNEKPLRAELNTETGKLAWAELQPHYARGSVVKVAGELDLVAVAECMVRDDTAAIQSWMDAGQISRAGEDDARRWNDDQTLFWAVVTAPWVLVQEITGGES